MRGIVRFAPARNSESPDSGVVANWWNRGSPNIAAWDAFCQRLLSTTALGAIPVETGEESSKFCFLIRRLARGPRSGNALAADPGKLRLRGQRRTGRFPGAAGAVTEERI
jgi:hypothetical protein